MEESAIEDAVEWFRKGGFLVVVDAADRENEGDLVIAAEDAGPEQIAFMIRNTSGLICAPMTAERAHCLNLPLMVPPLQNTEAHGTAFTVSVDVREGVTTGISAEDRSTTIRALASENTKAVDLVRPGHIFPLVAKAGGVLERPGHTEAAVDLCKMAGKFPVAAISEITLPDGSMARTTDLIRFSKAHGLPFISIEQIIGHRRKAHQPQPSELPT